MTNKSSRPATVSPPANWPSMPTKLAGRFTPAVAAACTLSIHVFRELAAATEQVTPVRFVATVQVKFGVPVTVKPFIGINVNCAVTEPFGLTVKFGGDATSWKSADELLEDKLEEDETEVHAVTRL